MIPIHISKTNTGNHNNYLKTARLNSKLSPKKAFKKTLIASSMLAFSCGLSQITYAQSNANHESNNNKITNKFTNNNKDIPTARLETIVITATKTDKSLSDSPIPINVISKTALEDNQPRTLKEAIQLLPNVTLQQVHGKSGYEVKMQGMSSEQVLVLIDGLPITASTGSTVNLNQYLNVEVEQIEVIQGASSAQYGSSAMGGVINVITKKLDTQKAPLSGRASVELASNGEQNPSARSLDANRTYVDASVDIRLDKAGHWQARLSGSRLTDDGLSLEPKKWARLKDKSEQTQASARLQYQPVAGDSSSQLWVEATDYQEDDESRLNFPVAQNIIPRQKLESINKSRLSAGFNHKFTNNGSSLTPILTPMLAGSKLQGKLFYENYDSASDTYSIIDDQLANKEMVIDRDATITTKLGQLQYDFPDIEINEDNVHLLQVGGQWQEDELTQTNNGKNELNADMVSRDASDFYIQDDWLIGDDWEVVTGVRYQQDSDFGSHVAPKIAVKYNHLNEAGREHILRASVGQGYRVPNLKERHFVFDHSAYGYMVMGNPQLKPETSDSYQLGYQGELTDTLNLTTNFYYNKVEDLIQADRNNPLMKNNIRVYHYKNISSASTYGGDIGVSWQVNDNNHLQATYAYNRSKDNNTNIDLVERPKEKASLTLNTSFGDKVRMSNRVNYQSKHLRDSVAEQYSPSWITLDSKVNYQVTPQLKVQAGVNNLFDRQRDSKNPNDQSPLDNRQWSVGATMNF